MWENMTLNQIRYLGVLDSLKVRKESYPMRRTFKMFYKDFADIGSDDPYNDLAKNPETDYKPYCERIVKKDLKHISSSHLLLGKTRVFMRVEGL